VTFLFNLFALRERKDQRAIGKVISGRRIIGIIKEGFDPVGYGFDAAVGLKMHKLQFVFGLSG
jgi:hypothetical protein